jgi:hypothetical protein
MPETYTVRLGILDTSLWSAENIVQLYRDELKKAGFTAPALPVVSWPKPTVKFLRNDPFPGAQTITVNVPSLGDFTQTRDTNVPYEQDPAKLAETGKALATVFAWNLCYPGSAPGAEGVLRDIFRRVKPEPGTMKTSPKVGLWASTPETLAGYPNRPASSACGVAPGTAPAPAAAGKGKGYGLWAALGVLLLAAANSK